MRKGTGEINKLTFSWNFHDFVLDLHLGYQLLKERKKDNNYRQTYYEKK